MPHLDPTPALTAAAALGRQARRERVALDDLLTRVEHMAVALAREDVGAPGAAPYAPERDAALLQLWRTARRAYEGADATAGEAAAA